MNKALFLGGGGDPEVSENFDKEFFSLLNNKSRILYIPLAWNHPNIQLPDCYEWFCGLVGRYLSIPKENISMYDGTIPYDLNTFDAIYIGGGNTYKLRDSIEKHSLINPLKDFLASGKPIYGGSAGAIIFGKEIATVIEEKLDYPNYAGLKFCNFSMKCHYQKEEKGKLQQIANSLQTTIYALPEDGGLILDNNFNIIKQIGDVEKIEAIKD
ncbi:MAG: Type 1 glutamine amidotransferase-like domain-containing protein [Alphaproteobacteria bacterium]|nr:Type 1 glutamine amidotransferase-like domain-containing protein [Alphaproteobacteria bacterium]